MPQVSVIIPAYNAESTIKCTIESVLNQTFADFEIIIINDGSGDRTTEIICGIKDPRIKLFSYENGGLPTARNRGIQQAQGEYLAFLDADDLWTPDKLAKQLNALVTYPEAGVAYSRTCYIDKHGKFLYNGNPVSFAGNVLKELLLTNFLVNGSNPLIRRQAVETIGKFDAQLSSSEDWDYYLRLAHRYSFAVVPEYQIIYRKTASSMSSDVETMKQTGYTVLNRAYKTVSKEMQYLCDQSFSILHLYCAELSLQNAQFNPKQLKKVSSNLWLSIRFYPQSLLQSNTQRILIKYLLKQFSLWNPLNFLYLPKSQI